MSADMLRNLTETVLKNLLTDVCESPERGIRKAVDMVLQFTEGRFQKHFFQSAQTMLENEESAYYELVRDVVSHVDRERIISLGMNVGYNSCTSGAKMIRRIESAQGYNVPWSVMLRLESERFERHLDDYKRLLLQGLSLGIYTWQIWPEDRPELLFPLTEQFSSCAFILYCTPDSVTDAYLEGLRTQNHVMTVVLCSGGETAACAALRERRLPYAVCQTYDESNWRDYTSAAYFAQVSQLHPTFAGLMASPDCQPEVYEAAYDAILQLRQQQRYPLVPWEVIQDSRFMDGVISSEPCTVMFDAAGRLCAPYGPQELPKYSFFDMELQDILAAAFPKHENSDAAL